MVPVLVEKLVKDGLTGPLVFSSKGEGPNMSVDERMQVAEA